MQVLYHGSHLEIPKPEIRKHKFHKDFYWGFYCTDLEFQAIRWATRRGRPGVINLYAYKEQSSLSTLHFPEMNEDWLDFVVACRSGEKHSYDVVEGPMADDTIFNYLQSFLDGTISRAAFWELAKFKHPTHQISFHTARALDCLKFEGSYSVNANKK